MDYEQLTIEGERNRDLYRQRIFFEKHIDNNTLQIKDSFNDVYQISIIKEGKTSYIRELKGKFWMKKRSMKELIADIKDSAAIVLKSDINLEIEEHHKWFQEWNAGNRKKDEEEKLDASTNKEIFNCLDDSIESMKGKNILSSTYMGIINNNFFLSYNIPHVDNGDMRYIPCIILNNGNMIKMIKEDMLKNNIVLKHKNISNENGWSLESMHAWIKHRGYSPYSHIPDPDTGMDDTSSIIIPSSICMEVYRDLINIYNNHIEFPEGEIISKILSCWTIGTYVFTLFNAYPYIFFNGTKATGKTKALTLTSCLAFNAVNSNNMSPSSLFRIIQARGSTILIDEGESLENKERREIFRELLLSGYKKGMKTQRVEESKDDDGNRVFETKEFDLYSPKMIANISGMEEVMESRCITINMKPALNQDVAGLEIDFIDPLWQFYKDKLYWFAMDMCFIVKDIYDNLKNDGTFRNREWELWKPILTISKIFGDVEYDEIKAFAAEKIVDEREKQATETNDHLIIKILVDMVDEDGLYSVRDILNEFLTLMDADPMRPPKWVTPKFISNSLRRLGIKKSRRGTGGGYRFEIKRKYVEDLGVRYNIIEVKDNSNQILKDFVSEVENQ